MKKSFLLLTLLSLTLVGCNQVSTSDPDQTREIVSDTEQLQIVASFYPLAFMTEQIVGDKATVINLAGAGDVHDYEPSPQDMVKINTADLLVYQGAQLEPWANDVIPTLKNKTLEVSAGLDLAKIEDHEDHDDHEDEDEHEDEHEEHAHGEFDPHTWLDPVLALRMVDKIVQAVIELDPANQDLYGTNAQALKDRFNVLDQSFTTQLNNCAQDEVIVSHDAYGYLARRYDFEMHAIGGISTQDTPSAKTLAMLKEEAEEGITHILAEENNVQRFADTLATETGLAMLTINPLGKGTLDPNKDFFDVMAENLMNLSIALDCQS